MPTAFRRLSSALLLLTALSVGLTPIRAAAQAPPSTIFGEGFDGGSALPSGWTETAVRDAWFTTAGSGVSGSGAAAVVEATYSYLQPLQTPPIDLPATGTCPTATLQFEHSFRFADDTATFNGGVLEIAIDLNDDDFNDTGEGFVDIETAGGSFSQGGYAGAIEEFFNDPLEGREAWGMSSGGFQTTIVTLPAAAHGHAIRLQRLLGTADELSDSEANWDVDNVTVTRDPSQIFAEDFNAPNPTPPDLPSGWTTNPILASERWQTSSSIKDAGTRSAFGPPSTIAATSACFRRRSHSSRVSSRPRPK